MAKQATGAIRVAILARDGVANSGLGVTLDILAAANRIAGTLRRPARERFSFDVLGVRHRSVRTSTGHRIQADSTIDDWQARRGDIVIVPGISLPTREEVTAAMAERDSRAAIDWLAAQWRAGATIAVSCSATFLLAETGLLDGRQATTSWFLAPFFQSRYPRVKLRSDRVVTRDGRLLCAGAALGQADLALAIVRDQLGAAVVDLCKRYLLLDDRPSQTPYVHMPRLAALDPDLARADAWIRSHLAEDFAITDLARAVALGTRTLARRIEAATGVSPIAFVQRIRAESALTLLESTRLSFEEVAARVGYRDPGALRRVLRRETGRGVREIRGKVAAEVA